MTWPTVRSIAGTLDDPRDQPLQPRALERVADELLDARAVQRPRDELVDARAVEDLCDQPLGAGALDQPRGDSPELGTLENALGDVLDAPVGENAVREAVGHAGAQQLLGDPLDDRVAGHVARGGLDQRPAHRTPDGVLGERALQHVVDRPLRVRGRDHGIDDGQRGAAGEVAGGRPCAALQTLSGRDGLCDRPERHADCAGCQPRDRGHLRRQVAIVARGWVRAVWTRAVARRRRVACHRRAPDERLQGCRPVSDRRAGLPSTRRATRARPPRGAGHRRDPARRGRRRRARPRHGAEWSGPRCSPRSSAADPLEQRRGGEQDRRRRSLLGGLQRAS